MSSLCRCCDMQSTLALFLGKTPLFVWAGSHVMAELRGLLLPLLGHAIHAALSTPRHCLCS